MMVLEAVMSEDLLKVLAELARDADAKVYVVGGYLRDRLLGREPVDLDLLVEGSPTAFLHALSRRAAFEPVIFSRREPITYRVAMDDWLIDVSACRPGGLVEALARRDFTINALAAPLRRARTAAAGDEAGGSQLGETIDPLGGAADLKARRIRHIAPGALDDDPIRLLRGVRLAVVLEGFTLDDGLRRDIRSRAASIDSSPPERILAETEVVLASPRAGAGLRMMAEMDLLFHVFPELKPLEGLQQNHWHRYDALEHTLRCVEESDVLQSGYPALLIDARLGVEDAEVLKWSALYHDAGKAAAARVGEDGVVHFYGHETLSAQIATKALQRLRAGARKIDRVRKLIENHLRLTLLAEGEVSEKSLRRIVHQLKYDTPLLCLLALADRRAGGGEDFDERLARLERLASRVMGLFLTEGERVISPSPLLSGSEVMEILGLRPGPRVGSVMRWLTRLQVEEKLTRRDEAVALLRSLPQSRILTLDEES
jgi:putative nucleotidyltransferase with HDIG domain